MNRVEFMGQLEKLLQSIPQAEREEALQYYNDYFDDAGEENEKEVMDALGNPAKVAESIKRDLYGKETVKNETVKNLPMKVQSDAEQNKEAEKKPEPKGFFGRIGAWFNGLPDWGQIVMVIVLFLLSPVIVSLAGSIVTALFGLIVGWFSLIFGFAVAAITLIVMLFLFLIAGLMCIMEAPFGGMALIGLGLLCGGIGILFLMLTVAMAGIATPAMFRGLEKLFKSLFGKKEVAA